MENYQIKHIPVMVDEVVFHSFFEKKSHLIDATFGAGGHTKKLLETYQDMTITAIDWDKRSLEQFGSIILTKYPNRFTPLWGNFAHLYKIAKKNNIRDCDAIIADFGTSQMQIFEMDGFSFQGDTPLDMRMSHGHFLYTAADIVNSYKENELADLFWRYSQEPYANKIARAIVFNRKNKKITTTSQLVKIILSLSGWNRKTKIHPATRVFQALRMAVNNELENINSFLHGAFDLLKPGGRIICISFHSLEDGLVKDFFNTKVSLLQGALITKKALKAQPAEIDQNPASRSARLRVFQKNL